MRGDSALFARLRAVRVSEAIQTRRNVRSFSDRPIDPQVLTQVVDAARHAPSSMNDQRWIFVVVTDRQLLRQLAGVGEWAGHIAQAGAAVALAVPDADDSLEGESIAFDLGQAAQNLMLAAWERGLGSCHATVDKPDRIRELLAIPEGWKCDLVLSVGHPADTSILSAPPHRRGRKPLDEVLRRERW
jgi:nitroreductase